MERVVPHLRGDRVLLREPRPEDVASRLAIGSHREIVEAYGAAFDPRARFTEEQARNQIDLVASHSHAWIIDVGGFIGHVRFHSFAPEDRRAALAIGIEDPARLGQGYGTEAIKLALTHIFSSGWHRISLRVLATNGRAIHSYRKCGFVEEAREREAALIGDRWIDDLIMGVLDRDFFAIHR